MALRTADPDYSTAGVARAKPLNPVALASTDFLLEVEKGSVEGHRVMHKLGRNPGVLGTEDIWFAGGAMNWPTAAGVVSIVSTSANDTAAGTGARSVIVEGLLADWSEATETVALNGLAAVTTTQQFIRINRVICGAVGTYHSSNVGNITGTIGGAAMFSIEAGKSRTQLGRYSVPLGVTAYLLAFDVGVDATKSTTVFGYYVENAGIVAAPYGARQVFAELDGIAAPFSRELCGAFPFLAKTDVWWSATVAVGTGSTSVNFGLLLVDG